MRLVIRVLVFLVIVGTLLFIDVGRSKTIPHEHFSTSSSNTRTGTSEYSRDKTHAFRQIDRRDTTIHIYDTFYSYMYRRLVHDATRPRVRREVNIVLKHTRLGRTQSPIILDVGCGVGSHLALLSSSKLPQSTRLVGLDQSEPMLVQTKKTIAQKKHQVKHIRQTPVRLIRGDFESIAIFESQSVTHITAFYFSLYYASDVYKTLDTWISWLKPGGYMCLHLVDPAKFDPVLDVANPFVGVSAGDASNNHARKTNSTVHLKKHVYHSKFTLDLNDTPTRGIFEETFTHRAKPRSRVNVHRLVFPHVEEIIEHLRHKHMILDTIHHLKDIGYVHQYIACFRKN